MRVDWVGVWTVWQLHRICGLVCPGSVLRVFSYLAVRRKQCSMWFRKRAVLELGGVAVGGAGPLCPCPESPGREVEPAPCSRVKLRLTVNPQPPSFTR